MARRQRARPGARQNKTGVWYGHNLVGTLVKAADGGIGFSYAPTWLSNEEAFPVASILPLVQGAQRGDLVFAAFDNLLPDAEGELRAKIAERVAAPDKDVFSLLSVLGPEPLGNDFHENHLAARLKGRATPIKSALLDQHLVAGLGNIYVCEVLFRAGIHPARLARDVTGAEVARLVPLIRQVLEEAIEAGGSSLKDYRQADGELGYFQHRFRVYDREGEACTTPGCGATLHRIVQSGRSSFFCLHCQR